MILALAIFLTPASAPSHFPDPVTTCPECWVDDLNFWAIGPKRWSFRELTAHSPNKA